MWFTKFLEYRFLQPEKHRLYGFAVSCDSYYMILTFMFLTPSSFYIAKIGSKAGLAWGVCKYKKNQSTDDRCKSIQAYITRHHIRTLDDVKEEWKCNDGSKPWHCSPTNFQSGINNYVNVDTFTIVQDPYTRMISEYYAFVKKKSLLQERNIVISDIDDSSFMNEWIINAADTAMKKGVCYAGHCIPMHKYVYDTNGKRVIRHVLKVEHLDEEFNDLMKQYNLSSLVTLEDAHMRKEGVLGVEDLLPKAIEKINEWGKLDFDYFGYEMRNPYDDDETSMKNVGEKSTVSDTTAVVDNKKNGPDVAAVFSSPIDDKTSTPFPQNERGLHKLEFVHIAKTGGTSIELAGKSKNLILSRYFSQSYSILFL